MMWDARSRVMDVRSVEHAALERGAESVRMIEVIVRIVRHAEALHHAL